MFLSSSSRRLLGVTQRIASSTSSSSRVSYFHASAIDLAKLNLHGLAERVNLQGQNVLVRVDLNVPLDKKDDVTVTDDTRIREIIPTTKFLLEHGANVILVSHFGRPKGEIIEKGKNGRLTPVVPLLNKYLGTNVIKVNDCMGPEVEAAAKALTSSQVLLLENTRFYKGEEKNDVKISEGLGKLAEYFVMDAFGTAHRAHSSTAGVTQFMKLSAAGFLMEKELKFLKGAVDSPVRPLCAIIGGAKGRLKLCIPLRQ